MREQLKVTVTVDREWFRFTPENDVRYRLAGIIYSSLVNAHHKLSDTGVQTVRAENGIGDALSIVAHDAVLDEEGDTP